ncbi:DNA polymerase III, subunit gamma and tau [Niastella koreensis]|uniref:DNA polymerase III subunit gamma/tau n=2 Tax=Niastella koreensis TaxID=354356 RepID=G8TIE0_NIAKG|nr:DNA polymerase III subunit gamma/tau [Niastella koreensis]AEW01756.1 DNA polymerase III, subunits gamma and tau [Niastella koreensis GR20-10]OQP48463.1 DNA polymerase III, subunit gamma and tau [Niastella koreensis]
MDKFIVSARKYRPQTFDTVVGQAHITTTLQNAIKNHHLAHAFLFCGPRGVGKTTCARILAKTINCDKPSAEGEACNECPSCNSFNEGTSLNVFELDAASNNSVEDIRSLVEKVRFAPEPGKHKVYVIDEVHMLSSSAFNAFLKTLEEPPSYAIFILATTEKHKILPTILSRCQIFDFKRITNNDTVEHLEGICKKEAINAEKPALQIIARKSEGCMRDALSILDKIVSFTAGTVTYQNTLEHLNILDADYYFKLIDCMQNQDLAGAMLLYDDIDRKGFEGDMVLNGFSEFIRNLLVCKDEKVAGLLQVVESFKDKYIATGQKTPVAYLISALNILNEAEINFKSARNKRLHTELAIIKLTYLQQALELAAGGDGLAKKKVAEGAQSVAFRKLGMVEQKKADGKRQTAETVAPKAEVPVKKEPTIYRQPTDEAKLIIEEPSVGYLSPDEEELNYINSMHSGASNPVQPQQSANTGKAMPKLGTLESIRQKYAGKQAGNTNPAIPLTLEQLQQHWADFSQKLKDNKNPAAQSFDMAQLVITSGNSFEIVTNNNLEQKFIEGERRELSEFVQQKFNNRTLLFTIVVTDKPVDFVPTEKPLSTKEQYIKIIEQYPLVNELRSKLRLGFD